MSHVINCNWSVFNYMSITCLCIWYLNNVFCISCINMRLDLQACTSHYSPRLTLWYTFYHVEFFVLIHFKIWITSYLAILNHFKIQTLKILFSHEWNHKKYYSPKLYENMSFDINKLKIHPFEMAAQKNLKKFSFSLSKI